MYVPTGLKRNNHYYSLDSLPLTFSFFAVLQNKGMETDDIDPVGANTLVLYIQLAMKLKNLC